MKEKLIKIGFTEKEAVIYLALLKLGKSSAPTIAKHTTQDRRTVYDALDVMAKKGLVSITKIKNILHYDATPPEEIFEKAKDSLTDFKQIIPDLKQLKPIKDQANIGLWYGVKAADKVINNALQAKSEFLLMGRGGYLLEQLGDAKYQYIPKLKQIKWRMIQTQEYKKYPKEFRIKNMRYLPKDIKVDTGFAVFDDKVYLFTKKHEIEIIEIVDKSFANTYRAYFELFWQIAQRP